MPDLPTITVTTEQQARILAALKAEFGVDTAAEAATAYKRWIARMLIKVLPIIVVYTNGITRLLPSSSNIKSNSKITFEEVILIEHITGLIYNSSVIAYENLKGVSNSRKFCSN